MTPHAIESFANAIRTLRAQQDGESSTYKTYTLSEEGEKKEIKADGIFIELPDGRGLFIQLTAVRRMDGVLAFSYPVYRDDAWSRFVVYPMCPGKIRLDVEKRGREL